MIIDIILKDEDSCDGCPLLNVAIWNEAWRCGIGLGSILCGDEGVRRPRPDKCKLFFKDNDVFTCE